MIIEHTQWYLFIGVLLVSLATLRPLIKKFWFTVPQLQLLCGVAIGPLWLGLASLDWVENAKLLEIVSEVAVIISLYATGVKMREPLLSRTWIPALLLASLTMVATIALTLATGMALLGLTLPAAILLGAILAPTDPVLADEVQVADAHDDDPLRRTLTGEAGFNDGTAFPFVLLAVGLSDPGLHEIGDGLWRWLLIDIVWKILAGIAMGWIGGRWLGRLTLWMQNKEKEVHGIDEIRSLGFIALVYGVALALNTYAFLAVFAAAVSLRQVEMRAADNDGIGEEAEELLQDQSEVATALESIVQVLLVVIVGVLWSTNPILDWQPWVFALLAIFVIRPVAVMLTFHTGQLTLRDRLLCAWFGIRGIGTVFYLSHAVVLGVAGSLAEELPMISASAVATIVMSILLHGTTTVQLCNQRN
jgi:NhaP-type Na+/H+ or K+/H+ antiporter